MRGTTAARVAVLGVGCVGLTFAAPGAQGADHDCGDFATQADAQAYYDAQGYRPGNDPERLDADHDGRACEARPCPCAGGGGAGAAPAPASPKRREPPRRAATRSTARVVRVVDGDTVRVRLADGRRRTVRLIGIDAPESSTTRYGARDCGGGAATASMRRLLRRGATVELTSDPTQDRSDVYGRALRYVSHGGVDVGRRMVRAGWAEVYVFRTPFRRRASYQAAAAAARRDGLGVWRSCGGDFHTAA